VQDLLHAGELRGRLRGLRALVPDHQHGDVTAHLRRARDRVRHARLQPLSIVIRYYKD
jgi:hypothetical protein